MYDVDPSGGYAPSTAVKAVPTQAPDDSAGGRNGEPLGREPDVQRRLPPRVGPPRAVHVARSPRRRRPARLVRLSQPARAAPVPASDPANAAPEAVADTQSELRDWVKANSMLLSNASLLISISALALSAFPNVGILTPYIKALIFAAALLLLAELHLQWPDDLQIHMFGRAGIPRNHSWRMTGFAILMQLATALFAIWAVLNNPAILLPLAVFAVIIAFRTWYFRRFRGPWARLGGILALILVLIITEILTVVIWAVVAQEQITIELWTDRIFSIEVGE